nr:MDIS1-interacting receptor like kinase 2-like [Tanacetum cinerariifolium]
MLHENGIGVPSPVPKMFWKRETAVNAPKTFQRSGKRFICNGNGEWSLDIRRKERRSNRRNDYENLRKSLCVGYASQLAERMIRHNGHRTVGFKSQLVQVHSSSVLRTYVAQKRHRVSSPVPETFRKWETAGDAPEMFRRSRKHFICNGNGECLRRNGRETGGSNKPKEKTTDNSDEPKKDVKAVAPADDAQSRTQAARERFLARKGSNGGSNKPKEKTTDNSDEPKKDVKAVAPADDAQSRTQAARERFLARKGNRGGKYVSQEFEYYLKACGIVQELTPTYTPQHNGVSERRNRTFLDMIRSMMNLTTLSLSFWDYALDSVTRILNINPTKKVEKTSYELWYEKVSNLSYLKAEKHSLGDLNDPSSYKAVMLDPESNKWLDAMNAKMQSMIYNMVWVLVDLLPNLRVSGVKTFSPFDEIRAIRILISIVAFYDYEIWQMNIKTAFLNGYLDEDIYMVQPESFVDPNHPRKGSLFCALSNDGLVVKMDWMKRVNIIKDVTHALAYMHHDCNPPIVHRDISSNNILLYSRMEGLVASLGAARLLDPDSSNQTVIAGTLEYIAPGKLPGYLLSSLKYSTGCGTMLENILDQRLSDPIDKLIEKEIIRVCHVALSCVLKDPKARPTMREVYQELSC